MKRRIKANVGKSALDGFVQNQSYIDKQLTTIKEFIVDESTETSPEDITWADVGSLNYVIEQLKKIINK